MIAPATQAQAVSCIRSAHDVLLTSYILRPGAVLDELLRAAKRGARVTVRLEGRPYSDDGTLGRQNAQAVAALAKAGSDARLVDTQRAPAPRLHMKALVCDGVAFLDDRNWPDDGRDTILRDDFAADVRVVRAAANGRTVRSSGFFWTTKGGAIKAEARMLDRANPPRDVVVESESFDASGRVYGALKRLAQHVHCRLLVSERDAKPRTLAILHALSKDGVEVRLGDTDEKFAVAGTNRAWAGSANATTLHEDSGQIEWAVRTNSGAVVQTLRAHFERNWRDARPLR